MKKLIALSIGLSFYAALLAQSAGDYRTVASGTWSTIAIWQRYNGTGWKAATTAPTYTDGVITIRDGHNVTVNTNITIDQATVDGGGQLSLTANVTITLNNGAGDDLTVNGLFLVSTGVVAGTGNLVLNNQLQWSGGALEIKTTNTGAIALAGTCSLYDALTNSGTVTWQVGRLAFFGGSVVNNGVFTVYTVNEYLYNGSGGGTFTNNATGVVNVNTLGILYNQINFTNKGVINFNSGSFINTGTFTNSKTMNFSTGIFENEATTNLNSGTKLTGSGTLMLYNNTLNVNAAVAVPASITLQLSTATPLVTGTGSLSVSGPLLWSTGTISVPVTINSNGVMTIAYNNVTLTSSITNNGTINWSVGNIYFNGGTIVNNSAFNIISDYQFIKSPSGTFTNNASGVVTRSSFGTTTINIPFSNKGTIAGTGNFSFGTNLTNTGGTFDPGVGTGTANLTVGTNYTNSTLLIKIKGLSAGLNYDRVTVTGNATLKGTLTVTASGTVPEGADTILKTTGTITGKFATVNLPTGYTISYRTNKVIINIPLPALQNTSTPEENMIQAMDINKQFSVFPNPATQSLFINYSSKNKTAVVQIFDLNSNEVYRGTIETGKGIRLNIGKLISGTYILSLKDGDKTQTTKFIRQ